MIVPVFKTGGWQVFLSLVGSTPTRFRQFSTTCRQANHLQIRIRVMAAIFRAKVRRAIAGFMPLVSKPW